MTMMERIARAIAASRTGTVASWRDYRVEAQQVIDACSPWWRPPLEDVGEQTAPVAEKDRRNRGAVQPSTSISASSATTPLPRG